MCLLLASALEAQVVITPVTLNFNDLGPATGGVHMPATYRGFQWGTSDWHYMTLASAPGETFLALSGNATGIRATNANDFYFDGAEIWSRRGADANGRFYFYLLRDGAVVYDGRDDPNGRQRFDATHQTFTANYAGPVDYVAVVFDAGGDDWDHLAMDNLQIRTIQPTQFTAVASGLPEPPWPCVAWGDYDSDGDLDILIAGEGSQGTTTTAIFRNTAGVFANSGVALTLLEHAAGAWGDCDGDGDLDLAMTGLTPGGAVTTRVYRNNGGTFAAVTGSFSGVYGGRPEWVDYDGDGDLDLFVTGYTGTAPAAPPLTRLYRNDASIFTAVVHPFGHLSVNGFAWGDYDGDGDPDLLSAGALIPGSGCPLWRNDGGTFTNVLSGIPDTHIGFLEWGDYDNDGDLDLLFGGDSDDGWVSRIYRNDSGAFVNANAGLTGVIWSSAKWGDYDNDGDLDCVVSGYEPVSAIARTDLYRNDAGAFVNTGLALHESQLGLSAWADYDNDGDLDLLIAGNADGGDHLSLYRNNAIFQNSAPSAPAGLAVDVHGTSATLMWGAATDGETAAPGLYYNVRVGTTPGGSEVVAPHSSSTGYRRLPGAGNQWQAHTRLLRGLAPGQTYYWSVQSVDTAFAGSAFAAEGSFTALADAPANVGIVREAGGAFRTTWRGTPGASYRIETSADLSVWIPAATVQATAGTGVLEFLDTPAPTERPRFYRAVRP